MSITLTSIIYRIIFGRIAQVMVAFENISIWPHILLLSQKGFALRVDGCD
jgi:hypothetical protein